MASRLSVVYKKFSRVRTIPLSEMIRNSRKSIFSEAWARPKLCSCR